MNPNADGTRDNFRATGSMNHFGVIMSATSMNKERPSKITVASTAPRNQDHGASTQASSQSTPPARSGQRWVTKLCYQSGRFTERGRGCIGNNRYQETCSECLYPYICILED